MKPDLHAKVRIILGLRLRSVSNRGRSKTMGTSLRGVGGQKMATFLSMFKVKNVHVRIRGGR